MTSSNDMPPSIVAPFNSSRQRFTKRAAVAVCVNQSLSSLCPSKSSK